MFVCLYLLTYLLRSILTYLLTYLLTEPHGNKTSTKLWSSFCRRQTIVPMCKTRNAPNSIRRSMVPLGLYYTHVVRIMLVCLSPPITAIDTFNTSTTSVLRIPFGCGRFPANGPDSVLARDQEENALLYI